MRSFTRVTVALIAVFLIVPSITDAANPVIMNNFGALYESTGFPSSTIGDVLTAVGVVTSTAPSINLDLSIVELTWIIQDLVSEGQISPDGGRTIIVSYAGGTIGLYSDPQYNHDFGENPPNPTAPSTFTDGTQFLVGSFTQFMLFFDTVTNIGAFQGLVNFTNGTALVDLPNPNGMIFAGTISPNLDPTLPAGYNLATIGQIIAPSLCTVRGNVGYTFDAAACEKCKGITRLEFAYNGTGDVSTATVSCGAQVEVIGSHVVVTPDTSAACSDDDDDDHHHHHHDGDEHENDRFKLPKEITLGIGHDLVTVHTSCSRPIETGNVIGDFTVVSVDKVLVPCDEEKCGGVTELVLHYLGMGDPNTAVVSEGALMSVVGDTITIVPTGTKLKANTTVSIENDEATIHTSCSQPLEPGFIYGEFEVLALTTLSHDGQSEGLSPSGPVTGVTVDLIDGEQNILSMLTDEFGNYVFYDVATDTVSISVVVPLGYSPSTVTDLVLTCGAGETAVVDFSFERTQTADKPRSRGFWKHQVNSALKGKHKGVKVSAEELLLMFEQLHSRFDQYFSVFVPILTLNDFKAVLSPEKKHGTEFEKARAEFAGMLLNVVSNRLATWQFVSDDNATVSQAITHVSALLGDGDPSNDSVAHHIAKQVNKGKKVAAGTIPLSITQIAYTPPGPGPKDTPLLKVVGNYPNPFNPATTISYALGSPARVSLTVYNIRGQRVRELVSPGTLQSGDNLVPWNGQDEFGRDVASGVYYYRLRAGREVVNKQMILLR